MHVLVTIISLAFLSYAGAVHADSGKFISDFKTAFDQGKTTHFLEVENDSMLLKRDDRFYTSGLRYTQQYALHGDAKLTVFGWRIGQELYTAWDTSLPPGLIGPPDHPYAGWLYGGLFKRTHRIDGTHEIYGMDLGCIGPCAGGEWTQNNLHRLLGQNQARGWDKQIKNEAGLVLYADFAPLRWTAAKWLDVTPNLHVRFGNIFTDAGAGATLRVGQLNLLPGESTLHGFVRVDARAVGYNATLEGGYFSANNPHTVKPKRLVGEAEIGLAWQQGQYGLSASVVRRGNEIRGLSNALGAQNFARVTITYIH